MRDRPRTKQAARRGETMDDSTRRQPAFALRARARQASRERRAAKAGGPLNSLLASGRRTPRRPPRTRRSRETTCPSARRPPRPFRGWTAACRASCPRTTGTPASGTPSRTPRIPSRTAGTRIRRWAWIDCKACRGRGPWAAVDRRRSVAAGGSEAQGPPERARPSSPPHDPRPTPTPTPPFDISFPHMY